MEERLSQQRAPVFEALKRFQRMRVVPFDVPGHKRGKGTPELTAFLGEQCMSVDVNSMKPLTTCATRFPSSRRLRSWPLRPSALKTPFSW